MANSKSATASAHKKIIDLIEHAADAEGQTRWQIFTDFLSVATIGTANPIDPIRDAAWWEREERYIAVVKRYKDKELFPKIMGALAEEFQRDLPHYVDVLGEVFHTMNFHDEWKGQFFTPQYLCDAMARMNCNREGLEQIINRRGFVAALEPAVGSGAMLLAIINWLLELGLNPSRQAVFFANDLDERCVHMAYIQLSLVGVPAIVQQKNTLTGEAISPPWYTPAFLIGGWAQRLDLERRINQMWDWLKAADAKEPEHPKSHFTKPATPTESSQPPAPSTKPKRRKKSKLDDVQISLF